MPFSGKCLEKIAILSLNSAAHHFIQYVTTMAPAPCSDITDWSAQIHKHCKSAPFARDIISNTSFHKITQPVKGYD